MPALATADPWTSPEFLAWLSANEFPVEGPTEEAPEGGPDPLVRLVAARLAAGGVA